MSLIHSLMDSKSTVETSFVMPPDKSSTNVSNDVETISKHYQGFYLKPFFFPLIFFLSMEGLVPNSPRSGWDIVWEGPKPWLWLGA